MKINLTLLALLISIISVAQNGINYKALIKDTNGNVITNQSVDIVFSIQHENVTQYSELQQIVTDNNGIAIATIGEGSPITNTFDAIDWKLRDLELNVQIDLGDGLIDFGNSPFNAVPYAIEALNKEGLEAIDEGNGVGWRLNGRDPNLHGAIGENAVDLTWAVSNNQPFGATGDASFATGAATIASANYTFASGILTHASGSSSTAIGSNTEASGSISFAAGFNSIASSETTIAMGYETNAVGSRATALGDHTIAESRNSTAIGRYNIGGGNSTTWSSFDPLFEIGNGSSNSNRNNALTVRKNGTHVITSSSTGMIINSESTGLNINAEGFGMFIGDAGVDGIFIQDPEDDGVYIEGANDDGISIFGSGGDGININNTGANGMRIEDANTNGIRIDNSSTTGIRIEDSGTNGILVSGTQTYGASITGDSAGLRARATVAENPDIILRGNSNVSNSNDDDGIISSDPNYGGSDLYIRSYDAIIMQLDFNDNEAGNFNIRNGDAENVFSVNESGNVSFDGSLQLGNGTVECPLPDIRIDSNDDMLIILDNDNNESGFFGIYNGSVSASNAIFQVIDSGDAFLAGNLTQASDRRLKRDIEDLSYGLKEILQLNPKQYYWKDKIQNKKSLGLIAQEVKPIIENIVNTQDNEEKTLGISYTELIPILINAIKEQNKIIQNQGEALKASHTNYEALLSRIEHIESHISN